MIKGELIQLQIEKYAFEGKGIARINFARPGKEESSTSEEKNFVVFVSGAYPGDEVKARILKVKSSYAEAKAEELINPSDLRTKAECKYFGTCGGCKQQDLNYDAQLRFKKQQVEEIFKQLGGFEGLNVEEIIPSPNTFYYRNKMEFSFSSRRWLTKSELSEQFSDNEENIQKKNFALGLHIPRIYDKVLAIEECFLQSALSSKIVNLTREFFIKKNIPPYSTNTHSGYLRNLVIRQSAKTSDLMVNLVTSREDEKLMKEYTALITNSIPEITTVVNNINTRKAAIAVGEYEIVFYGSGSIIDWIGKYKFKISANSFFQTNTLQAENLYQTALDFASFKGDEIVYDLYSGAGTIAAFVSEHANKILAFESSDPAINDARENLKLNEIKNIELIKADLYESFLPVVRTKNLAAPDVIIIDPPRSGMHPVTVNDVIKLNPDKIVYVSCNPATQVRDIKILTEAGYELKKIRPVDMFPHTYHIESVALLQKS
jgi:23S rRNA (uracil1939-C5)-methyltransferase